MKTYLWQHGTGDTLSRKLKDKQQMADCRWLSLFTRWRGRLSRARLAGKLRLEGTGQDQGEETEEATWGIPMVQDHGCLYKQHPGVPPSAQEYHSISEKVCWLGPQEQSTNVLPTARAQTHKQRAEQPGIRGLFSAQDTVPAQTSESFHPCSHHSGEAESPGTYQDPHRWCWAEDKRTQSFRRPVAIPDFSTLPKSPKLWEFRSGADEGP